jgi:hypothetical protein
MNNQEVTREQLIAAYKPFVERGVQNPFAIFDQDDETKRLSSLDTAYHVAQAEKSKTLSPEERIKAEIAGTTVFVDAGFTDIDLLDEIARDWLVNVLSDADALGDQALVSEVKDKIKEVELRIQELDPTYELTVWDD